MTREESMYQAALKALQAGNPTRAKDLFTRLIKANPRNPQYWLWMSSVVNTEKERAFCLKEVLRLDPENKEAQIGMTMLGLRPRNPDLILPYDQQKRKWEVDLGPELAEGKSRLDKKGWTRIIVAGGGLLLLVALVLMGALGVENSPVALLMRRRATPTISKVLPTYAAVTPTSREAVPLPLSITPTPGLLSANYTPTAVYINTPHPITEAYRSGIKSFVQGEWKEAIQFMRQVATVEPDAPDLYYYIGESQRMQGDLKSALNTFNETIQKSPSFAPSYLGRARARLADTPGRWQEAQGDLKRAVTLDSSFFEAYLELARLEISRENGTEALQWLEQAAQLSPDSVLLYDTRARAYLTAGEIEAAIADATRANQLDTTYLEGYRLLAEAYIAAGEPQKAVPPLEIYTTYQKGDVRAVVWLGMAYAAQGEKQTALQIFNQAIKMDDRDSEAYLQRGLLSLSEADYSAARDDLEKALSINKKSFPANIGLGIADLELGFAGNAYQQFSIAEAYTAKDYDRAQVYYWRAQSLERLGEEIAASRDWQALLRLNPQSIPGEWIASAQARLSITPTPSNTRQPTRTLVPTQTRWPTLTPTP